MNSTFGIWLIGAGVAALALLLLLGTPVAEVEVAPEPEAAPELDLAEADSVDVVSSYWQPVVAAAPAPEIVYAPTPSVTAVAVPCSSCGATAVRPAPASRSPVGGCGYPSTPCGKPPCSRCQGQAPPTVSVTTGALVGGYGYPTAPCGEMPCASMVGGCGYPSMPCGPAPCSPVAQQCPYPSVDPCRAVKAGINRNMPLCVDECSFIQLHSTVPHPICEQVSFEWSASKGRFLDPTASDPLFFAPPTQFVNGEDVWIALQVTDPSGASYSDVVSVHIRDLP